MRSYERDLLLYAHRDEPPFWTRDVPVPAELATVSVRFPPELLFKSEQRRVRLHCKEANETGRRRTFGVVASETIFERSGVVVLNVVLEPPSEVADESQLNEYDLIKLIKLWEGGEEPPSVAWEDEILFETADGKWTLDALVRRLFRHLDLRREDESDRARRWPVLPGRTRRDPLQRAPALAYRVGTVELEAPESEWRDQLFHDIAGLKDGAAPDQGTERARWDSVVAVGGVLQGLLDFRAITSDELADVFGEVDIDSDDESPRLVGFHKGTLLAISAEDEPDPDEGEDEASPAERPSPIGVDPYIAIPNVVLLHNEQRLKDARQLELALSRGQPRPSTLRGERVNIDKTANGLDEMTGLLAQHLPNIFHYPAEQGLYETGSQSRGFGDLKELVQLRREELMSTLQRRERTRDRWTAALALVGAIGIALVVAVQEVFVQEAIEMLDWWIILIAAGLLYVAWLGIRNRLF